MPNQICMPIFFHTPSLIQHVRRSHNPLFPCETWMQKSGGGRHNILESKGVWTLISYLISISNCFLNLAPYGALDGLMMIGFGCQNQRSVCGKFKEERARHEGHGHEKRQVISFLSYQQPKVGCQGLFSLSFVHIWTWVFFSPLYPKIG